MQPLFSRWRVYFDFGRYETSVGVEDVSEAAEAEAIARQVMREEGIDVSNMECVVEPLE